MFMIVVLFVFFIFLFFFWFVFLFLLEFDIWMFYVLVFDVEKYFIGERYLILIENMKSYLLYDFVEIRKVVMVFLKMMYVILVWF